MADKKITGKPENPMTKQAQGRPEDLPSMDSRDGHGLTKTQAMKGKN